MNNDLMRTGDKGFIKFRFMYRPEYLKVGTTILFREGRTKGLGVVSRIFPDGAPLNEKKSNPESEGKENETSINPSTASITEEEKE